MKAVSERLLLVLGAEEEIYARMRDLLQRERELMVELDATGLEEVVREKEVLADEGRLVEESRLAVAAELSAALGLPDSHASLSLLCEQLGPGATRLRETHTRLVVLVSVVQELLDANRTLAGESLDQVRTTLRMLGTLLPSEVVYERGPRAERAVGAQLVRRTA